MSQLGDATVRKSVRHGVISTIPGLSVRSAPPGERIPNDVAIHSVRLILGAQSAHVGRREVLSHHSNHLMSQDLLQIALEHHRSGRLRQAEANYRTLLAGDPANAAALHWLGVLLAQAGDYAQSLPMLREAASLRPGDDSFQFNHGHAALAAGNVEEAIEALAASTAIQPDRPETWLALATARLMRRAAGDIAGAIEELEKARSLGGDSAELYHHLSVAYLSAGRFDEAITAGKLAVEKDPTVASFHLNLALAHRALMDPDEARRSLQKSIELRSGWPRAWHAMALLEAECGQWQKAADLYQFLIDLDPDNAAGYRGRANALERLGNRSESVELLREAVRRERSECETCWRFRRPVVRRVAFRGREPRGPAHAFRQRRWSALRAGGLEGNRSAAARAPDQCDHLV